MALDERIAYARESALRRASNLAFFIDSRAKMGDGFSDEAYRVEKANLENVAGISFDQLIYEARIRSAAAFASGIIAAQPEAVSRRYFLSTSARALAGYIVAGGSRALSVIPGSVITELLAFQKACGGSATSPTPMSPNPSIIPPIAAAEPVAAKNSAVNLFDANEVVPFGSIYVLDAPAGPVEIPIINGSYEITPGMNIVPGTYKMIIDTSRGRYGLIRGLEGAEVKGIFSAAGISVDTKDGRYETPLNVMKLVGNKLGTGDINRDIDLNLFIYLFLSGSDPREPRHSQRHMSRLDLEILAQNSYRANDSFTRIDSVGPYTFLPQVWERLVNSIRRDIPAYTDGFYPPEELPPGALQSYVKVRTDVVTANPSARGKGYWFPLDNLRSDYVIGARHSNTDNINYFFLGLSPTYSISASDLTHDNREMMGVEQRNGVGIDERTGISHPSMSTGSRGLYGRDTRNTIKTNGYPTEYILPVVPLPVPMSSGTDYNKDTFRIRPRMQQ